MDDNSTQELIERIEQQLDAGFAAGALDLSAYAVRRFPSDADLWALYAESLEAAGRIPDALKSYGRALQLSPDWLAGHARRGSLLIEQGKLDEARGDVTLALEGDPGLAEAQFNRAILAEFDGNDVEAARAYRTAEGLDPTRYYLPLRVAPERFNEIAEAARSDLPTRLREYLTDVPLVVKPIPDRAKDGTWESGPNPLALGYCAGRRPTRRRGVDPWRYRPSGVMLFKKNIERICTNLDDLLREVTVTLYHESLFFLGVPEEDVTEPVVDPNDIS